MERPVIMPGVFTTEKRCSLGDICRCGGDLEGCAWWQLSVNLHDLKIASATKCQLRWCKHIGRDALLPNLGSEVPNQ